LSQNLSTGPPPPHGASEEKWDAFLAKTSAVMSKSTQAQSVSPKENWEIVRQKVQAILKDDPDLMAEFNRCHPNNPNRFDGVQAKLIEGSKEIGE
jgi:hypothetical protein